VSVEHVHLIAGLSWDPAIRGILVVGVGVTVLLGSIYLILGTNLGARLGLLVLLSGLFGWLTILTMTWWIQPPGNGPRGGNDPHWVPLEIYVHPCAPAADGKTPDCSDDSAAAALAPNTSDAGPYPFPYDTPRAQVSSNVSNVVDQNGLTAQLPANYSLSDVAGLTYKVNGQDTPGTNLIAQAHNGDAKFNGWKVVGTSAAGEAQSAADVALAASGLFKDATEYKKLEVYDKGGLQTRDDACPDSTQNPHNLIPDDALCRAKARLVRTFQISQPPHYQVVNIQRVIPQETVAGSPPPLPVADPSQPIISVIMVRDQGNVRAKPAAFFFIAVSLFIFFTLLLHFRDKTVHANRTLAADSPAAKYAASQSGESSNGDVERDMNPDDGGG
jgi:hypothetical protein